MHVTAPVPKITDKAPGVVVPAEVEAIIQRLMEKESKKRFATARELIEALERTLGLSPLPGSSPSLPVATSPGPSLAVHVDTILTRAEKSLAGPLEKIPLKTTKRNKLFAAAGGIVLALVLALGLVIGVGKLISGGGGKTATGTDGGPPKKSENPLSIFLPDTGPESKIAALAAKVDRGEAKDAIPELEALASKYPERPDVHRALAHAYLATNDTQKMIAEAGKWGVLDEKAAGDDTKIVDALTDAALDRDSADAAFPVLELKLGEAGADALYEIAYGTVGKKEPLSQIRARKSLTAADVKKHFSPALAVTLDIKMSSNICDTKKDAFPEAKRVGDQRTLDALMPFTRTRGCGFLNTGDCFGCIRGGDDSLDKVMAAIRARIKK
jgi:serine/threonine-protein kinase